VREKEGKLVGVLPGPKEKQSRHQLPAERTHTKQGGEVGILSGVKPGGRIATKKGERRLW